MSTDLVEPRDAGPETLEQVKQDLGVSVQEAIPTIEYFPETSTVFKLSTTTPPPLSMPSSTQNIYITSPFGAFVQDLYAHQKVCCCLLPHSFIDIPKDQSQPLVFTLNLCYVNPTRTSDKAYVIRISSSKDPLKPSDCTHRFTQYFNVNVSLSETTQAAGVAVILPDNAEDPKPISATISHDLSIPFFDIDVNYVDLLPPNKNL